LKREGESSCRRVGAVELSPGERGGVGGWVGEKARGRIRRDREDGRELAGSQPPATPGQFRLQRFLLHGLRSGTQAEEEEEEGKSRASRINLRSRRLRVICPELPPI